MRKDLPRWLSPSTVVPFVVASALLAIIGPFGTFSSMSLPYRFLYWGMLVLGVGTLMILTINYFLARPETQKVPPLLTVVAGCAVAATPGMIWVTLVRKTLGMAPISLAFAELLRLWFEIWFLGSIVGLVDYTLHRLTAGAGVRALFTNEPISPQDAQGLMSHIQPEVAPAPQPVERSRMHRRLAEMGVHGTEVFSMSMQDHYVEVFTDAGSQLVLMRLTDAILELDGVPGLRVHRSHWVANAQMKDLRKSGNRWFLDLHNGGELPVSKTYLDEVQAALQSQHRPYEKA